MPPATKESFARALDALVRKYEADRDTYLSSQYNEAQTRTQFITPLLEALGWDVRNEAGVPYNLCEVLEEKGETHGRPDYTFRINGQTKFFLEAKSPSDELSSAGIIQTKRYAWNSRDIFFAGVCDFEQFKFFDASLRPDDKDPNAGEAIDLIYSQYAANIDKLWELSRDRVAAGSLDQFLRKDRKSLLQKVPVDKDFLDNLTIWRHDLANAIHAQNPQYDAPQLNDIVQRLLDRIIFIRIAEDRKVIDQRQLWDIAVIWDDSGGRRNIMEQLVQVFQEFNARFNGEIFKPHPCEEIKIESHALVKIIKQLYPPKSNYRFDVIGVELLGSIYERYLGNTLRITPKRVFIEPKPEVRKAGGVYYTPQYIVDYIVKNTVGKLVEGKTPKEVDKIRILDPACGSGSFLIGAFQFLIDWYLNYYREHPKEAKPGTIFALTRTDQDGNLRLSFSAKSLIIQHNLYGVDIDPQAVEVTMMSLYLKMLEGELGIQIPKQDKLPELKYNIRCGNSLIGPDIELDEKNGKPLTPEERQRINPFDWNSRDKGFGDILKSGGFDAIIANPPYIRIQTLQESSSTEISNLKKRYVTASSGNFDIYVCFVEKGLRVLNEAGKLGFILPSKFFQTDYGKALRELIVKDRAVESIVDFSHFQVFDGPTTYTCLLFLSGAPTETLQYMRIESEDKLSTLKGKFSHVSVADLSGAPWVLAGHMQRGIFEKLELHSTHLLDLPSEISRGSSSGADDVFIVRATQKKNSYVSREGETLRLETSILRTPLYATDFGRYSFAPRGDERIIFPYHVENGSAGLIQEKELRRRFPYAFEYLRGKRRELETRKQFAEWYSYSAPRNLSAHDTADLLVPLLADKGLFSEFPQGQHNFCLMASGGFSITLNKRTRLAPRYLLGLLNSKLLFAYLKAKSNVFRGGWITCTKQYVGPLPIRIPNPEVHEKITSLVGHILELKRKHSDELAPAELQRLERQIADTDAEIDNLVYDLYAITPEERKIIEGTGTS